MDIPAQYPGEQHVGFTGTRTQLTPWQLKRLRLVLESCQGDFDVLHHGGAEGADIQAHFIAEEMGFAIEVHPATKTNITPFAGHTIHPRKPPLDRNHDIVLLSSLLIAVPAQSREILRSGTWATIRYARANNVEIEVIYP